MAHFLFTTIFCLLSITFLKFCLGVDTLFPNQTIAIDQTLISQSQDFELGFFSPGKSRSIFLGIWYKSTPDIVVWVANRNNPISDSQGVTFAISRNGALVLSRGGSIMWSASTSGVISNPVLQLLDTGNLVLVNETMEGSSQSYIWQSFDCPTDTWLPGMKIVNDHDAGVVTYFTSWRNWDDPSPGDFVIRIENEGLPEFVVYRGKKKMSRSGKWNGLYFNGFPRFPNEILKPEIVFKEGRLISMTRPFDSSIFRRSTLDISGLLHRYTMNARKDQWNHVYTFPGDQCDNYGLCGPNGICRIDESIRCECFKGFAPKSRKEWDLQDWSGGCTRITPLNCSSGDGFLEVRGVKYPDTLTFQINTSMSLNECQAECLKNCSCTAYSNAYITNGGCGCMMWFGDLIDTRELSGADSKENIYIRLPVSELAAYSTTFSEKEKKIKRPTRQILISIASGVLVSGFINGGVFMMTRRKRREQNRRTLLTWPKRFDVIMGIARGLLYLHHDSRLKIIHRDLKTSNILLDRNLNPKISDFGIARTFGEDQPDGRTRRVVGTYGYMAPEYAIDGKFSVKSDIFSLGVVLLEIICGKKNRGFEHRDHYHSLLGHAWLLWKENKILELMDECLNDTFIESQVKRCIQVGLLCVQKLAEDRPIMSSVLFMLGTDGANLPEPKEPGFFIERSCSSARSCTAPSIRLENDTITITDLEAR